MTGPVSRRSLLSGRFLVEALRARAAPAAPAPPRLTLLPLLRPPAAVEEEAFLAACTRCDKCIEACPHGALTRASPRLWQAAGTPVLDPMRAPCLLCEDRPCVRACPDGALRPELPTAIGRARIDPTACLAHQGSFCTTCSERCPVPGALLLDAGRPRIDASVCTGCGVCLHHCPAPQNAIAIQPTLARPRAPGSPPP